MLRQGRIVADGPKREVLTADRLSQVFDAPIAIVENDGYYFGRLDRT